MVHIPEKARQYKLPKLEGIESLEIQQFTVPKPRPGEVLVRIHAVSLNYRDIVVANNKFPGTHENLVPCSDGAGEVVAVGEGVKKWSLGDRVAANYALAHIAGDSTPEIQQTALGGALDGVLTEYQVFPEYSLVRIPENLSFEEASTLPCAAVTAWNALNGPIPVKAGDYVVIQGTGGVSIFALQIAVASGATVIATSSSDEKLKKAKNLGAKHLINYSTTPDWDQEVLKITGGEGAHHIVEIGGPGTIDKSLNCIRMGGNVHIIGFLGEPKSAPDTPLPLKVLFKAAHIRGLLIGSVKQFEDLNRAIAANDIHPVIDSVFDFDETVAALKCLESQKHVGKIVIRVAHN